MRLLTIILAVTLAVISCVTASFYHRHSRAAQKELIQERYLRMVAEEEWDKSQNRLGSLESELERTHNKIKNAERQLQETRSINDELKNLLEKASQANQDLEHSLDQRMKEISEPQSAVTNPG